MSISGSSHVTNGLAPESRSWKHLNLDRRSPRYCRVTFDHSPTNTITGATIAELDELVSLIEQDPDLTVVVFDSVNPHFYLGHDDLELDPSSPANVGPSGWIDVLSRLSRAPVVSIASIRGHTGGAGNDFILACDLRFASRENTRLGEFEVGIGIDPESGRMARLSRLVGRGRALEILLLADHLDGPRAERFGYVNRLFADDELDDAVEEIAARLERFDHDEIARAKSAVDEVTVTLDGGTGRFAVDNKPGP